MERIKVSMGQWGFIVWTPIFIGVVVFSIFNSTFFIPKEVWIYSWLSAIGLMLVGWGFGLVYSRLWEIKGIDNNLKGGK